MSFKIRDRVVFVARPRTPGNTSLLNWLNEKGTIVSIHNMPFLGFRQIGVQMDTPNSACHTLYALLPNKSGILVEENMIVLLEEANKNPVERKIQKLWNRSKWAQIHSLEY